MVIPVDKYKRRVTGKAGKIGLKEKEESRHLLIISVWSFFVFFGSESEYSLPLPEA